MQPIYNQKRQQDAFVLFNETAQVVIDHSFRAAEKQIDLLRKNLDRQVARARDFQPWTSPEAALKGQQALGAEELLEWKKAGEAYYQLANDAGRDLLVVTQKGEDLVRETFDETVEQAAKAFRKENGAAVTFADAVQNAAETVKDFYRSGVETAVQAAHAGFEKALQGQQIVADAQQAVSAAANGSAAAAAGKSKKRRA